jgi:hypothetical protein
MIGSISSFGPCPKEPGLGFGRLSLACRGGLLSPAVVDLRVGAAAAAAGSLAAPVRGLAGCGGGACGSPSVAGESEDAGGAGCEVALDGAARSVLLSSASLDDVGGEAVGGMDTDLD